MHTPAFYPPPAQLDKPREFRLLVFQQSGNIKNTLLKMSTLLFLFFSSIFKKLYKKETCKTWSFHI